MTQRATATFSTFHVPNLLLQTQNSFVVDLSTSRFLELFRLELLD